MERIFTVEICIEKHQYHGEHEQDASDVPWIEWTFDIVLLDGSYRRGRKRAVDEHARYVHVMRNECIVYNPKQDREVIGSTSKMILNRCRENKSKRRKWRRAVINPMYVCSLYLPFSLCSFSIYTDWCGAHEISRIDMWIFPEVQLFGIVMWGKKRETLHSCLDLCARPQINAQGIVSASHCHSSAS